jgi:hypothetical protein
MAPDSVVGKSWISACHQTWYPSAEEEYSFGFTHYGTALVILVIIAAGIFAMVGVIKYGIKKRMKEDRETTERELSGTYETHSRVVFQQRENSDFETPDSPELRLPRATERQRTESQLTQPPTYEEAMAMFGGSREDVSRAGAESSGDNEQDNDRGHEHSGECSTSSDNSDDEQDASKALNNPNKLRRNSP